MERSCFCSCVLIWRTVRFDDLVRDQIFRISLRRKNDKSSVSLDRTLFYSNMTVSLCIRQESKRNDDSVSVEELDWSAERQVLIPAEHFWCDFKWAKTHHQTPMTCTFIIWTKVLDTPFFRREKGTSKLWQQRWKRNSCTSHTHTQTHTHMHTHINKSVSF